MKKPNQNEMTYCNLEYETSILGLILKSNTLKLNLQDILIKLSEEDFYNTYNKEIFKVIFNLSFNKGFYSIDRDEIYNYINNVGSKVFTNHEFLDDYLEVINTNKANPNNLKGYYQELKRLTSLRKIKDILASNIKKVTNNSNMDLEILIEEINFSLSKVLDSMNLNNVTNATEEMKDFFKNLEINIKGKSLPRLLTGYKVLDEYTGGLKESNLIVIAGRPGNGKTTFAINIINNLLKKDKNIVFVSLEMSNDEVLSKFCSINSGINNFHILNPHMLNEQAKERIFQTREEMENFSFHLIGKDNPKLENIVSQIRKINRQEKIDVIVIDYVQLLNLKSKQNNDNRYSELCLITRSLKLLAKEISAPIIILSQLTRDKFRNKVSQFLLSDLKDSGSIEQDADIVMFISSETNKYSDKNVSDIRIAKNRMGKNVSFQLDFDMSTGKFSNLSEKKQQINIEKEEEIRIKSYNG